MRDAKSVGGVLLLAISILTTVVIRPTFGQILPTTAVDRLFATWDKAESPGCAVGVVRNGTLVHAKGYGMADLEHGSRITPHSVFYTGSLSKQFTAMAIGLLAERGAVSLDDDIHKYLPELP